MVDISRKLGARQVEFKEKKTKILLGLAFHNQLS